MGHYLGTEIDECWWKRYTANGFFARGDGEYWYDEQGFTFRCFLSRSSLYIPFSAVQTVRIGRWHSGRWAWGMHILKLLWQAEGQLLSSGFTVGSRLEQVDRIREEIERSVARRGPLPDVLPPRLPV